MRIRRASHSGATSKIHILVFCVKDIKEGKVSLELLVSEIGRCECHPGGLLMGLRQLQLESLHIA